MLTLKTAVRFAKWTTVGALGIAIKLTVLALLRELLSVHYLVATVAAVETTILHNFCWHQNWTWADRSHGLDRRTAAVRLVQFHASTALVGFPANILGMHLLVEGAGLHYLLAGLICGPIAGAINFLLAEFVIFVSPRPGPSASEPPGGPNRNARLPLPARAG